MTLTVVAEDGCGVLVRVLTIIAASDLDVDDVALDRVLGEGRVRIRLAVRTESDVLEKIARRVRRLIEVVEVKAATCPAQG